MVKKANILLVLYFFFCSFTILVWGEKNILPNLTNSQEPEPGIFWPLGAGAAQKKYQESEPGPLGEKIRSRSSLKEKIRSRSR